MGRRWLFALLLVAACQKSAENSPAAAATAPVETKKQAPALPANAVVAPPAVVLADLATDPAVRQVDVAGLTLTFRKSGHVTLVGKDQWGSPLDTNYESETFLKNALPVLDRAVTASQSAALHQELGVPVAKR